MSTEANSEKEKLSPSPSAPQPTPVSWFKPKQSENRDSTSISSTGKHASIELQVAKPVGDDPKPVSFFGLFRSVSVPPSSTFLTPSHPGSPLAQSSPSMSLLLLPP